MNLIVHLNYSLLLAISYLLYSLACSQKLLNCILLEIDCATWKCDVDDLLGSFYEEGIGY